MLVLGEFKTWSRFEGDALAYEAAPIYLDGVEAGSVHQSGYKPRWAFNLSPLRRQYREALEPSPGSLHYPLPDGAAWDTPEEALAQAQREVDAFFRNR
jgi:hypothetical protein